MTPAGRTVTPKARQRRCFPRARRPPPAEAVIPSSRPGTVALLGTPWQEIAMALTRFEIARRGPYADGLSFGRAGAFEQIDGIAHFAVDPLHPANNRIVDLALAPRNAHGLVAFAADFSIVMPVDPARGNRR